MTDQSNADAGAMSSAPSGATSRRGPLRIVIAVLFVLLLAYLASPYLSFWRFTKAVRAKNHEQIASHVDFRSVRESLKQQLKAQVPTGDAAAAKQDRFAGLVQRLAPALIDQLVDAFITPEGLTALISDPQIAKKAKEKDPSLIARVGKDATKEVVHELGWDDVRWAFFTSPRNFLIDVNGTKLHYRFSKFRWMLKNVELPLGDAKV